MGSAQTTQNQCLAQGLFHQYCCLPVPQASPEPCQARGCPVPEFQSKGSRVGYAKVGRRDRVYALGWGYREGGLGPQRFDYCSATAFQCVPATLMHNRLPLQFLTPSPGTRLDQYISWYGPINIRKHFQGPLCCRGSWREVFAGR